MITQKNIPCNTWLLKDVSKKDQYWDVRKKTNRELVPLMSKGDEKQQNRAGRLCTCADLLTYSIYPDNTNKNVTHKLRKARFCHCRVCPICQNRRSNAWRNRVLKIYPLLQEKYPTVRYINVTLTIRNCPITELKKTLAMMSKAFKKMADRLTKNGTVLGYFRSVEVTREMDFCEICGTDYRKRQKCKNRVNHAYNNNCHPHFHVLFAVPTTYFNGHHYISKEQWALDWQKDLGLSYKPVVWVQVVKGKKGINDKDALACAVKEVAKYSVKVDNEFLDSVTKDEAGAQWLLELDNQISGSRAIGLGGIFKEFLKNTEPDDQEMIDAYEKEYEFDSIYKEFWQYFYENEYSAYVFKKILSQSDVDYFNKKRSLKYEKAKQNMEYKKALDKDPSILSDSIAHKNLVESVLGMSFKLS